MIQTSVRYICGDEAPNKKNVEVMMVKPWQERQGKEVNEGPDE